MRSRDLWRASKYEWRNGCWRASRNPEYVARGSRFRADRTAYHYATALKAHASGRLVDLGCGAAPLYGVYKDYVNEVVCVDWPHSRHERSYSDLEHDLNTVLPLRDNSFDTALLSEVLEHIYWPHQLMNEIGRVLCPGGKLILGVPFYHNLHEDPWDYYRYTRYSLHRMCTDNHLEVVELIETGGFPEVFVDSLARFVQRWPWLHAIWYGFAHIVRRTRPFKSLSSRTRHRFPLGYLLVARKPIVQ